MLYSSVNDAERLQAVAVAPFSLLRWFALLSGVVILILAVGSALFLARFVARSSIARDAMLMTQLVNNVLQVEEAASFFDDSPNAARSGDIDEFLRHLGRMPGVLRANAFARDGRIMWSTDRTLVGQQYAGNAELEQAFRGQPVATIDTAEETTPKAEQTGLAPEGLRFVENYLPVMGGADGRGPVIGAVEVYRTTPGLFEAIDIATKRIVIGVVVAALLLYATLFSIVWRGTRVLRVQANRLVAAEKLATAGEMASAVAHGLRNPLASIRSTAELCLTDLPPPEISGSLVEIVGEVDRLESWIRQYLGFARPGGDAPAGCDLATTIDGVVEGFSAQLRRCEIAVRLDVPPDLPKVSLNCVVLAQILNGLVANAVEAMREPGELRIAAELQGRELIRVRLEDTGPGMNEEQLAEAFEPFMTSKSGGLGLGLPMAREILDRHGGRLDLASAPKRGTVATLRLPVAVRVA